MRQDERLKREGSVRSFATSALSDHSCLVLPALGHFYSGNKAPPTAVLQDETRAADARRVSRPLFIRGDHSHGPSSTRTRLARCARLLVFTAAALAATGAAAGPKAYIGNFKDSTVSVVDTRVRRGRWRPIPVAAGPARHGGEPATAASSTSVATARAA